MVVDGAGRHQSKSFAMPVNLRLHFLPPYSPYSPELNPQEHNRDELRVKHHQAFDSLDALDDELVTGLRRLELHPQIARSPDRQIDCRTGLDINFSF